MKMSLSSKVEFLKNKIVIFLIPLKLKIIMKSDTFIFPPGKLLLITHYFLSEMSLCLNC